MNNKSLACAAFVLTTLGFHSSAMAAVLDLTSVTAGGPGTGAFTGSLGDVSVNGFLVNGSDSSYSISSPGSTFENSTIDNSSSQFSNSTIYTPSQLSSDRVGYVMAPNTGSAILQINFSNPVTNPIFHVANLDSMIYDFSLSGITRNDLVLLSGNGGSDGDGLVLDSVNPIIADANPVTLLGQAPSGTIATSGERSAYGSVQLNGTFSSLNILLKKNPNLPGLVGDGGSFTITTAEAESVPEPTTILGSVIALGLGTLSIKQKKTKN